MGTCYYAVNDERKEAYSLGKNSYATVGDNADTLSLEDRVALQYAGNPNFEGPDGRECTDAIAADLRKYEPFHIVGDYQREDPKYAGYRITGSRFGPDDTDLGTNLFFG